MKIGILQTGHPPDEIIGETGDYGQMFANMLDGQGFDFAPFAVVDGVFPQSAQEADGWIITGSRHGAYEDHDWIPPLEQLIRDIHALGLPLVGVCFGHQIIAQALGGKVEKFAGGWAVGNTDYDIDGRSVALNAWHQDQVVERPAGARVLARNDFCENAILAYGDTIWTVQAHPEYGSDFIESLIHYRGQGVIPEDLLTKARTRLDLPNDNAAITNEIAEFFRKERPQ